MTRLNGWYAMIAAMTLVWHECGYDLGLFCYRIGCGAFCAARERVMVLVPQRATRNLSRTNAACSNRSFTSYVPSTTLKD